MFDGWDIDLQKIGNHLQAHKMFWAVKGGYRNRQQMGQKGRMVQLTAGNGMPIDTWGFYASDGYHNDSSSYSHFKH